MMTIRCSTKLTALLFCLPLGLCVASTAWAASDDDDEEWHDTKGPRGESLKSDDSDSGKKSDSKADKDSDKDSDAKPAKRKKRGKRKNDGPPSTTKISFALLGSYGFRDPLAPGLGLRGGVHIEGAIPFYVGGIGEYFFGTQTIATSFKGTPNEDRVTNTLRFMYFGGELGVDVDATPDLLLRPMIGLGLGIGSDKRCTTMAGCTGNTTIHPTLTPGIVGLYYMGSFFLGLDFRYLIVPGASATGGAIVSATLGLSF